ncbi:MAG TPA: hypothetical protein VJL08_04775 [Dehalococcoidia bacterium]|nr:hypothetical protein [Dehalococcoidia bacterium]
MALVSIASLLVGTPGKSRSASRSPPVTCNDRFVNSPALPSIRRVTAASDLGQHAGQDLQSQILRVARVQPRKAVRVLQPSLFAHCRIMPGFSLSSKRSNPCAARLPGTNLTIFYPLDFPKTQSSFCSTASTKAFHIVA